MFIRGFRVFLTLAVLALPLACARPPETSEPEESEGSTFWEPGEWSFEVELDPWPARAGAPVTLRAVATMDDYDQSFSGTVSYRLATSSGTDAWTLMDHVGEEEGDMIYEATVTLPAEKVGIHFLVLRSNDDTVHELTDWTVEPR